jgi:DNA-binding MarR family transcriptional regulator
MADRQKRAAAAADPMDALLGYHLRRLSVAAMADLAGALEPLGLTPTTASLLFLVAANPGITQSDAGRLLGVLRANMVPLAAGLAKRGLLDRERRDGRSHGLQLSAEGRALQRSAWKVTLAHEARLFGALPAGLRSRMIAQFGKIWKGERA